jgi:hypothetical protein
MITLDKISFDEIRPGMRCRSLITNNKGTLTEFSKKYPGDIYNDDGFFTIIWDNGTVSINTIFIEGNLPWSGQNIEIINE